MKQVTYLIRGLVDETVIPATKISCESLAGVHSVHIFSVDADSGRLELLLDGEPTEELESALYSIMNAKGLDLVTPPSVETYGEAPSAPVPPAPTPSQSNEVVPEKRRSVSWTAALSAVIVAVVLAVLLTFSLTTSYMKASIAAAPQPSETQSELFDRLEVLDRLFRSTTVLDLDEKALMEGVLKGYVAATGDIYAEYFTPEEYQAQVDSDNGKMCGIGVGVTNGTLQINGVTYQVVSITNVYADSPAEAAGVLPGDYVMYVGKGENKVSVQEVGYTQALALMKGEEGTECAFTVFRFPAGASLDSAYEEVEITAIRKTFTTRSVLFRHYSEDEAVGIIRITGFDKTTRDQFIEAVETLKAEGCTSFVLDLRGNPGGLLSSVEDVLVLFLREGDVIITKNYASGQETITVACGQDGQVLCGTGELTREDVGKYRDLNISVLVNGNSASAAELFTSNILDYELGTIVGTTTYGKGCGQDFYSLLRYGYAGVLKLTTFYYSSPLGNCYDGEGITPHDVVELSEEAARYNINLLPDRLDNQLTAAVDSMK